MDDGWFKEAERSAVLEEQNWAGDKGVSGQKSLQDFSYCAHFSSYCFCIHKELRNSYEGFRKATTFF